MYQALYLGDFYKISSRRGSNGFGANPLTWSDIWIYFLTGLNSIDEDVTDYLSSIAALDNIWLTIRAEKEKSEQAKRDAETKRHTPRK